MVLSMVDVPARLRSFSVPSAVGSSLSATVHASVKFSENAGTTVAITRDFDEMFFS